MESAIELEFLTNARLAERERNVAQRLLTRAARQVEREQARARSGRLSWPPAATRFPWLPASLRQRPT